MIEKKKQGEHTTSTTLPGFSIRSCILRTIFRKIDTTLSHLMPSLMYDVRGVRNDGNKRIVQPLDKSLSDAESAVTQQCYYSEVRRY